jgi:hypothetical protein
MSDPSKEVVEACITALCGAESQGPREKVLAVIRTYEDLRRRDREARTAPPENSCPGASRNGRHLFAGGVCAHCGVTIQNWMRGAPARRST